MNAQQFEQIQQLVQPITATGQWLLPKVIKCLLLGCLSIGWLIFYVMQWWPWHGAWLMPLIIFAFPLLVLGMWSLLLSDLADLPQALDDLKQGITGLKDKVTSDKKEAAKIVVRLSSVRKFPSLLKELWSLIDGVDTLRTIVTHVIFLANPISWLLFIVSCLAVGIYAFLAVVTVFLWL